MSKFNIGDKVRYIGKSHLKHPTFYPANETVGKIKYIDIKDCQYLVQWSENNQERYDYSWCNFEDIELYNNNENETMTNEEIWKMLEEKMHKNGLAPKASIINSHVEDYPNNKVEVIKAYYESDVHNAIALAYKVGYLRSQKGRSFKIGKKKKKSGHWKPIDPNNLPKDGTKVRYTREHQAYKNNSEFIKLGEIGTFHYSYTGTPGVKTEGNLFCPWVSFATNVTCVDMWVEDDE